MLPLAKSPFSPLCPCDEREELRTCILIMVISNTQTRAPSVPLCLAAQGIHVVQVQGWDLVVQVALWVQDLLVVLYNHAERDPER